jgi:hypothetical protein
MFKPKLIALAVCIALPFYLRGIENPELCSKLTVAFESHHDESYNKELFATISNPFSDLVKQCQETNDFKAIAETLGEPFKSMAAIVMKENNGTHGTLNINVETNSITLTFVITHDNTYDKETWREVVASSFSYLNNEHKLEKLSPLFLNVINAGEQSGIHGSFNMQAE